MAAGLVTSVDYYRRRSQWKGALGGSLLLVGCALMAFLVVAFPPGWYAFLLSGLAAMVVASWRRPSIGISVILGLTLAFEEYNYASFRPITRSVPFFERLSSSRSISMLPISPLEILLALMVVIVVLRVLLKRQPVRANALSAPVAVFGGCLLLWLLWGLVSGGSGSIAIWELRGFAYFTVLALLVPQVIADRADVQLLLWVAVAGVGFKAVQGLHTYYVVLHGDLTGVQAITGHEDALFFGWMLVFLAGAIVYRTFKGQSRFLVAVLPFLAFTFVATDRRAAYVALLAGILVLGVLIATDPKKRYLFPRIGLPLIVLIVAVTIVGWNSPGPLGRPARAIKSIQNPTSTEDVQSNYYRKAEEADLIVAIRSSPVLGLGFGRPFVSGNNSGLSKIDFSLADYIPHNEIIWLWAKMGTVGFALFWAVFGSLIVYGCLLFRTARTRETKVLAGFITAAIVMQLVVSYVDLQLTFARNMVFLGILVGVLARLSSLDESEVEHAPA
jgi:hypothetical protein